MNHFIENLTSYMMFEVLECAWDDLLKAIQRAENLDQVIDAHESYLQQILDRALMSEAMMKAGVLKRVGDIFSLIIIFGRVQGRLHESLELELLQQKQFEKMTQSRSKQGKWGTSGEEELKKESRDKLVPIKIVNEFTKEVSELAVKYHELSQAFLLSLLNHPSTDLRFLRLRLDFNYFYERSLRKTASKSSSSSHVK